MIFTNFAKKLLIGGAIAVGVIGAYAFASANVALAAAPAQTAVPPQTSPAEVKGQLTPARLKVLYVREQNLQAAQQKRLANTSNVISKTQTYIDEQNGLGKDTTALVTALNAYTTSVTTAQAAHTTAQGILDTHAGFDGSGNVTDAAQARTTVLTAGQAQREFHLTLNQAGVDLRTEMRLWRIQNRQVAVSEAETAID
jgi:Spy/CpxP family protein refolding chaperone